jgi:hypothetical protein
VLVPVRDSSTRLSNKPWHVQRSVALLETDLATV